ncbi:MAG: hypothetical protein JRI23_29650 [Deltaproteobacteria bacterium]|jgi:predicted  nucleic acid-binding Zn-ribbon protein|nr:hypothetical protein [Deltaproteobacteria bacterium]MBW2536315.1 hypothetical protein [Deltaproteobacteria bacterium]
MGSPKRPLLALWDPEWDAIDDVHDDLDRAQDDLRALEDSLEDLGKLRQAHVKLTKRFEKLKQAHLRLRERAYRVELVVEAIFAHLESQGQMDRDGLRRWMDEIDAADGKQDGRARKRRT